MSLLMIHASLADRARQKIARCEHTAKATPDYAKKVQNVKKLYLICKNKS
jgi:hypothetical protein